MTVAGSLTHVVSPWSIHGRANGGRRTEMAGMTAAASSPLMGATRFTKGRRLGGRNDGGGIRLAIRRAVFQVLRRASAKSPNR